MRNGSKLMTVSKLHPLEIGFYFLQPRLAVTFLGLAFFFPRLVTFPAFGASFFVVSAFSGFAAAPEEAASLVAFAAGAAAASVAFLVLPILRLLHKSDSIF
jgi:hypothetical protein